VRLETSWLLERAATAMRMGDMASAIEHLRAILGEEPENAQAHALLAFALLGTRRRHAARHEAAIAVACDPELGIGHRARGYVALSENDTPTAQAAFEHALAIDPSDEQNLLGLSRCYLAKRQFNEAMALIDKALEMDATATDALEAKARVELMRGDLRAAEATAQRALSLDPESPDALTLLGSIRLQAGDAEAARDLARWALQIDPTDEGALRLMADLKARQSWWLGAWWRFMVWLSRLGNERAVLVLTLLYIAYQAGVFVLRDLDMESAALGLNVVWLVLCAYTWGAGSIQRSMVAKELASVRLKPEF
jgi:tetratricopeptide (TPR) repeat protein